MVYTQRGYETSETRIAVGNAVEGFYGQTQTTAASEDLGSQTFSKDLSIRELMAVELEQLSM